MTMEIRPWSPKPVFQPHGKADEVFIVHHGDHFALAAACRAGRPPPCVWRTRDSGNYFKKLHRRWKACLGLPKAITAKARKLARSHNTVALGLKLVTAQ